MDSHLSSLTLVIRGQTPAKKKLTQNKNNERCRVWQETSLICYFGECLIEKYITLEKILKQIVVINNGLGQLKDKLFGIDKRSQSKQVYSMNQSLSVIDTLVKNILHKYLVALVDIQNITHTHTQLL